MGVLCMGVFRHGSYFYVSMQMFEGYFKWKNIVGLCLCVVLSLKFSFFLAKYLNLQNQFMQVKKFSSIVALTISSVLCLYFIFLNSLCNFMKSCTFVFHVSLLSLTI